MNATLKSRNKICLGWLLALGVLAFSCSPKSNFNLQKTTSLRIDMGRGEAEWRQTFAPVQVRDNLVELAFDINPIEVRHEIESWPKDNVLRMDGESFESMDKSELLRLSYAQLCQRAQGLTSIEWKTSWMNVKNHLNEQNINPVEFVVSWVQSMPYEYGNEREKYAVETFLDGAGDCSDKSLLAMDVLQHMGFKVGLVVFEEVDHMGLALACSNQADAPLQKSAVFEVRDGVDWMYIECTTPSPWGKIPEKFANGMVMKGPAVLIEPNDGQGHNCNSCQSIVDAQNELISRYGPTALSMGFSERRLRDELLALSTHIERRKVLVAKWREEYDAQLRMANRMGCLVNNVVVDESRACTNVVGRVRELQTKLNKEMRRLNQDIDTHNSIVNRLEKESGREH